MADSTDLIEEQAELITRSTILANYTPEITKWFGDLNTYVRVMYNDSAELLRVLRDAEKNFTSIEGYVHDIENYPTITGRNLLDFTLLHEKILDDTNSVKARLGIEKSKEYITKLFPFLEEIYTTQFSKVSGNFQKDLKKKIDGNLDIFRLQLSARYRSSNAFQSFIVYPYFVHVLSRLLDDSFKLLTDLQEEAWKNLSEAKRAQLKAERDTLIQARQSYREEHSNSAVVNIIAGQESRSTPSSDSSTEQTISERSREVAKRYQDEERIRRVPRTIEEFLESEPSIAKEIKIAAQNAALSPGAKQVFVEVIKRSLRNAPKDILPDLDKFAEYLIAREQAVLLKELGGILPQILGQDDQMASDILQQTKALREKASAQQFTPAQFRQFYHSPIGKTQGLIKELQSALQAEKGADKEIYEGKQLELAGQIAIYNAQKEFFEAQAKEKWSIQQRVRAILGNASEIEMNPDFRVSDALGFTNLTFSGDELTPPDNFSSFTKESISSRNELLDQLRDEAVSSQSQSIASNAKQTKKNLERISTLMRNPAFLAGASGGIATGAGLYYAFSQGVATGAGALTSAAGGFAGGALVGTAIFPGIGTVAGGFIGAGISTIGSLAWQPYGGANLANMIGTNVYGLSDGAKALSQLQSAGELGKEGLTAMSKVAPGTVSAASKTGASMFHGAQVAASKTGTSILGGAKALFGSLPGTTISLPVTPIIAGTLSTVAVSTIVVTTMMTGAFITPNDGQDIATSRYVELTKVMKPDASFYPDNGVLTPSKLIEYTLTLTPKKDDDGQPYQITIIDATDTISLSSRGKPIAPTIPPLDEFKKNATQIYTLSYDPSFADTRVSNVLSIKFTVKNSKGTSVGDPNGETFSTAATVAFGNPPDDLACLVTDGNWTDEEKQKLTQAFAITSSYPVYRNLLCDRGAIHLVRQHVPPVEGWYGAYIAQNTVALYDKVFGTPGYPYSLLNLRYTLIHETGHVIGANHPDLYSDFIKNAFSEGRLESYNATVNPVEDFPESIAVYVNYKNRSMLGTINGCLDMPNRYPAHFAWEQTHIFPEDIGKPDGPVDPAFPLCK